MDHVMNFLSMGGYAKFVWPAYGIAALALGWMLLDSLVSSRRRRRELDQLERERTR
jgi:heme exporter protein D